MRRDAVRFWLVAAEAWVAFPAAAAVVSTCDGATADYRAPAACPSALLLAVGAAVILLIGGLAGLFVRTSISDVAGPRGVAGVAGRGLVPVHVDAAGADHEHAGLGRARRCFGG